LYQCTYPGCREERTDVTSIEAHVRMSHLNREAEDQVNITLTSRINQMDFLPYVKLFGVFV
jgi:hypothetical protein